LKLITDRHEASRGLFTMLVIVFSRLDRA